MRVIDGMTVSRRIARSCEKSLLSAYIIRYIPRLRRPPPNTITPAAAPVQSIALPRLLHLHWFRHTHTHTHTHTHVPRFVSYAKKASSLSGQVSTLYGSPARFFFSRYFEVQNLYHLAVRILYYVGVRDFRRRDNITDPTSASRSPRYCLSDLELME